MPCYHPLRRYVIGVDQNTGKEIAVIRSIKDDYIDKYYSYTEIPCGKCIGCRLKYSQDWANRMMMEKLYHDSAYFVTLTYDNDHVPKLNGFNNLEKSDLQKFWKRLRDKFPDDSIRYFACGEYGEHSGNFRPHYHAIIFGLHLDDLKPYKQTPTGDILYNSHKLQNAWSIYKKNDSNNNAIYDSLGFVVVAEVSWETCAYVARYVTKNMSTETRNYIQEHNLQAPFCVMSKGNGGIGKAYFDDHPDVMEYEYINLPAKYSYKIDKETGEHKPIKFRPPRYFEKLYEKEKPVEADLRKKHKQELAIEVKEVKMSKTDISYIEYLANCENSLKKRIKALDRNDI